MRDDNPSASVSGSAKEADLLVFGEVLFDAFPDGRRVLGGAPFNVAWGLRGFGREPLLISAVGEDAEGREVRERMRGWGMDMSGLQADGNHATGRVEVTLKGEEPTYEILAPRAWDFIRDPGAVVGPLLYHGTLALRSEVSSKTFATLRKRTGDRRFFDVNMRPPHTPVEAVRRLARGAEWVKVNLEELGKVAEEEGVGFEECEGVMDRFREEEGIGNVLLTAGSAGAKLRGEYGEAVLAPAQAPKEMVDTVGAGDAFSAVVILGVLEGWDAEAMLVTAGNFAAKVCGMQGATTDEAGFYRLG